jgi:type II secretory pathway pseudopilin PulG
MHGNGWLSERILARLHDDERGFTLLESLLAITVILGSVLSLAYSAIVGFSYEDLARQKQTATGIADQVMEQVRGLAWDRVTTGHLSADLGATRSDLSVTTPDTGYLVTGCAGDAVGTYRLFQCPINVTASSQPGSGEQVVASAVPCTSGSDCVYPLVRHAGQITQNNIVYTWRVYDTNNCPSSTSPGCTAATPYRVTVVVTWTGGTLASSKIAEMQSLFWSPSGCRSTATHPFAAPCQPFFYGTASVNRGNVNLSGTVSQTAFQSGDLFTSGAQSSVQQEQLSQAQGQFQQSGVRLVDDSGTQTAGGSTADTSAADTDPGTTAPAWSHVKCGDAGVTCAGGSVSSGPSNVVTLTAPGGETAESDSTTSAGGSNVCPPPADTPQTDAKPCGGSRIQQGGTLSAVVGLNGVTQQLGTATLAQVLAASDSPNKTFVDRVLNPTTGLCAPVVNSDGCLEESATRNIGTVNVGGLPSALTSLPGGWTGYYFSIVGYQDHVSAAVGSNGTALSSGALVPAPTASVTGGTVYCWNGLLYNSVSAGSTTAVSCAPLNLPFVLGGHTGSITISGTTNPATISKTPSSASATATDATAQVTPPSAVITYAISLDGSPVVNLTITVNLNTLEASGSYALAPTSAS